MFRNCAAATTFNCRLPLTQLLQLKAYFHIENTHCAKNAAINSQAKIMGKLFGERVSGSKKRWYPTQETNAAMEKSAAIFSMNKVGVASKKQGKNTTRRMAVLNKLFMEHISDLLATSNVAAHVQGRGLQVTRVKITSDFGIVNVYWMGSGEPVADLELDKELQRCSGLLRHELSQLYLMGQIPRINFVRDRSNINVAEIDALLRDMNLDEDDVGADLADELKRDFNWKKTLESNVIAPNHDLNVKQVDENNAEQDTVEALPEMRHDVLGLDHRHIMFKILTKMRKSKQAWELHERAQLTNVESLSEKIEETENTESSQSSLERINQQIMNAAAVEEKFGKFLAKRRELKSKAERYKEQERERLHDLSASNALLDELEDHSKEEEDYIEEDSGEKKS